VQADHAKLTALEAAELQAARGRHSSGGPSRGGTLPLDDSFLGGVDVLRDSTELHLASFCMMDTELRPAGADDPTFSTLKAEYADVLGGAPPGLPPESCMELVIVSGDAPMSPPRPVKRLSERGLAELRTKLDNLLEPALD
jgi:hypothetical protein